MWQSRTEVKNKKKKQRRLIMIMLLQQPLVKLSHLASVPDKVDLSAGGENVRLPLQNQKNNAVWVEIPKSLYNNKH